MKLFHCLPLLAGFLMSGCVGGPQQQQHGIWPWEYGKDTGNYQTGDYIAIRGNVAQFGEVPKAVKPITPETQEPRVSGTPSPAETAATKTNAPVLPTESKPASAKAINKAAGEYDFSVGEVKVAPPSYLPANSASTTYDITAYNHGFAPVSVSIGVDPNSSENLSADKNLPFIDVINPNSDQALVRFGPKKKDEAYNFKYSFFWSIGDFTAVHQCPERYQFPFGSNIKAYASVSNKANATPYTRHAVIFSMPAGTPVLAARKGMVVQIKGGGRVDIMHVDSTIATYSHLGKIAEGVYVGQTVSTEDIIGTAGTAENPKEAFIQLTVWRPEPLPNISLKTMSPDSGFDLVSFPLEFCAAGPKECKVLAQDQWVSRNNMAEKKKAEKRKVKSSL